MTDLTEIAGREEEIKERIERLEALEYETAAFPAGGGFSLICDQILAAPAASVNICSGGSIRPGRHLWLIIAAQVTATLAQKMEMNINLDFRAGFYRYYTREELSGAAPVGSADTEADHAPGVPPFGDSKWEIAHPSADEAVPAGGSNQGACLVQFPDYSNPDVRTYMHWFSFANYDKDQSEGPAFFPVVDSGGGAYGTTAVLPPQSNIVSRITLTGGGGQIFDTGSQFTLYGL